MRLLAPLALFALLSGCVITPSGLMPGTALIPDGPIVAPTSAFGQLLTATRAANGLGPLGESAELNAAAAAHLADMNAGNFLSHTGSNGSSAMQRVRSTGYCPVFVAENVAEGQNSMEQVMAEWMASDAHRRNILRQDVRDFGFAIGGGRAVLLEGFATTSC